MKQEFIQDLCEYFNLSQDDVILNLKKGNIFLVKEWNEKNPQTDEEIRKFYKETENYIYDLGRWHFEEKWDSDLDIVDFIKRKIKPKKILDFGAGIGQNSYILAKEGFDITVADLDSKTLDFAEWRFKKHDVKAKFWRIDKDFVPENKFDLILCFDVLEHLSKKELKKTVDLLNSLKTENCEVLIDDTSRKEKTNIHPMHFDSDKERNEIIALLTLNDVYKS